MRDIDANSYTGRRRLLVINRTVVEVNGCHIYTALGKQCLKYLLPFNLKYPVATSKIKNLSEYLEITNFVARTRKQYLQYCIQLYLTLIKLILCGLYTF